MSAWIIGAGDARDHATFATIRRHGGDARMALLGGNALLADEPGVVPAASLDEAVARVVAARPEVVIVLRPELLFEGVVDTLDAHGCRVFGPGRDAARLERSKLFTKRLFEQWRVATPEWIASASVDVLERHLRTSWRDGRQWVIKSDLYMSDAALRTRVPDTLAEALDDVRRLAAVPVSRRGPEILLERREHGPELSLHLLLDGRTAQVLRPVSDYKTLFDGDRGPNTHGMGAACGAPLTAAEERALADRVLDPLLAGLSAARLGYRGVLYVGVIWTDEGPRVLELNVRPGNPEWVALLACLASPLGDLLCACAAGRFDAPVAWADDTVSGCLFMTVPGYPTEARYDRSPVEGLPGVAGRVRLFGEGIRRLVPGPAGERALVAGAARSLCLAATGLSIDAMRESLYAAAAEVDCPAYHYRRDIGLGRRLIRDGRGAALESAAVAGSWIP